jgi:hypothetical protein
MRRYAIWQAKAKFFNGLGNFALFIAPGHRDAAMFSLRRNQKPG